MMTTILFRMLETTPQTKHVSSHHTQISLIFHQLLHFGLREREKERHAVNFSVSFSRETKKEYVRTGAYVCLEKYGIRRRLGWSSGGGGVESTCPRTRVPSNETTYRAHICMPRSQYFITVNCWTCKAECFKDHRPDQTRPDSNQIKRPSPPLIIQHQMLLSMKLSHLESGPRSTIQKFSRSLCQASRHFQSSHITSFLCVPTSCWLD